MLHTLLCSLLFVAPLTVRDLAPNFEALDCEGQNQSLIKLLDAGPVVLVFFPKAFTSGCTQELTAFAAGFEAVKKRGAQVVAISSDSSETLSQFKKELKAPYIFIADPKGRLMDLYRVKMPLVTVAKRTTFVIDRKGNIVRTDSGSGAVKASNAIGALDMLGAGGL